MSKETATSDKEEKDLFKMAKVDSEFAPLKVTFSVPYKTEFGQSLVVVGDLESLGRWKSFKATMKWNEGHVWSHTASISEPHFQYKYVVLKDGKPERWEQGPNRIGDMRLL